MHIYSYYYTCIRIIHAIPLHVSQIKIAGHLFIYTYSRLPSCLHNVCPEYSIWRILAKSLTRK